MRDSIINLKIKNQLQFTILINKTFQFGIMGNKLSILYAKLCKDLSPIFITVNEQSEKKTKLYL